MESTHPRTFRKTATFHVFPTINMRRISESVGLTPKIFAFTEFIVSQDTRLRCPVICFGSFDSAPVAPLMARKRAITARDGSHFWKSFSAVKIASADGPARTAFVTCAGLRRTLADSSCSGSDDNALRPIGLVDAWRRRLLSIDFSVSAISAITGPRVAMEQETGIKAMSTTLRRKNLMSPNLRRYSAPRRERVRRSLGGYSGPEGILCPQTFFAERLGLGVPAHRVVQHRQVVQRGGVVGVPLAQGDATNLRRLLR